MRNTRAVTATNSVNNPATNPVRQRWADGQPALGAWLMIPSSMVAEEVGHLGYDYVCVDMQHGLVGYEAAVDMIRAINLGSSAAFVRVPWNDPSHISKMLDAGAVGVIVPMVNSPEEAARAAAACRFAPQGERSHAVTRAARLGGGVAGDGGVASPSEMNQSVVCIPMVETQQAVAEVAAIAAVPGVDAVYVGPGDLSLSLGLEPANNDGADSFDQALAQVLDACRSSGVVAGIQANPKLAQTRVDQGFDLVTVATDNSALRRAMSESLAQLR